jgi:hypothetical protein
MPRRQRVELIAGCSKRLRKPDYVLSTCWFYDLIPGYTPNTFATLYVIKKFLDCSLEKAAKIANDYPTCGTRIDMIQWLLDLQCSESYELIYKVCYELPNHRVKDILPFVNNCHALHDAMYIFQKLNVDFKKVPRPNNFKCENGLTLGNARDILHGLACVDKAYLREVTDQYCLHIELLINGNDAELKQESKQEEEEEESRQEKEEQDEPDSEQEKEEQDEPDSEQEKEEQDEPDSEQDYTRIYMLIDKELSIRRIKAIHSFIKDLNIS